MRGPASEIFTKFKPQQRPRGAIVVAIIAHALLVFAIASLLFQNPIRRLIDRQERKKELREERVQFVRLAPVGGVRGDTAGAPTATPTPPPAGSSREPAAPAPLRAPTSVPDEVPPPSSEGGGAAGGVPGGKGTGGGDGVARGVTPSYDDPRIWVQPGPFVALPRTAAQRADSLIRDAFGAYADSAAVANAHPQRAPGDWTVEKGGQKWGVDQKWVHLGKVKIPTAVLALLPLNVQGNPQEIERQRAQRYMRSDIMFQANRSLNEDEFRDAVKRIRERKDREKREAEARKRDVRP